MNSLTNYFPPFWITGLGVGANSSLLDARVAVGLMQLCRVGLGGGKSRVRFLNDQLN